MNPAIMRNIESIIPPLTSASHKGQAGRIGIIGGSKKYTGAPYFAAISALRVGCDLSHVFCTKDSSQVIKSYSPEIIVHPNLDSPTFVEEISSELPYLHSLVIGPGLGRERSIFNSTHRLIHMAKESEIPVVFDADALYYLKNAYDDIACYKKAILTPNKIEFARLYSAVTDRDFSGDAAKEHVEELSKLLGNVTIVKKGLVDIISDGVNTVVCDEPGSARRCGGQGDVLSGAMGVFSFWAHQYYENLSRRNSGPYSATILAALAACMLTRRCNYLAFQKFKRGALTTDMIGLIPEAFSSLFEK